MNWMELNSDKTKPAYVDSDELKWQRASQASGGGVWRKMLERKGNEVARATTIVKFEPHQEFPRHTHGGGEEFVVLDGTWHDDYGAFPKYTYVRNYIGSGHTPKIKDDGCTILVKLRQMSKSSPEPETTSWPLPSLNELVDKSTTAITKIPLFSSSLETTYALYIPKGCKNERLQIPPNGCEMFVLEGSLSSTSMLMNPGEEEEEEEGGEEKRIHKKWGWCRIPNNTEENIELIVSAAHEDGAYVWIKEGHLNSDEVGVNES